MKHRDAAGCRRSIWVTQGKRSTPRWRKTDATRHFLLAITSDKWAAPRVRPDLSTNLSSGAALFSSTYQES